MVWGLGKKKAKAEFVKESGPDTVGLVRVGEPAGFKEEEGKIEKGKESVEPLDVQGYWNKRLDRFQNVIDERLWKAGAVGRDRDAAVPKGKKDLSYVEHVYKAESAYIELRCALVDTVSAPDVVAKATNELRALKMRVGTKRYPRAIMGMIQSCLHEQKMGFHTIPGSLWDFDVDMVELRYYRALQGLEVSEEGLAEAEVRRKEEVDE